MPVTAEDTRRYKMVSVSALTNQNAYLEKSILTCVDSVVGKSNLKFKAA